MLVTASEILRTLSPSRLATLMIVSESETQTQSKVADIIGRNQSTVSSYFRSLKSPVPLSRKRGKHYTVTDTGRATLDLISTITSELGLDLQSVDWSSKTDRKAVGAKLSPLHDSRSVVPFLILYSLYERSEIEGREDTPQSVWIDDVIFDVNRRLHEIDESSEIDGETDRNEITKQIRPMVDRFEESDAITYDGSQLTLTKKGHQQAWLLAELVQFLAEQEKNETAEGESETTEQEPNDFSNDRAGLGGARRDEVTDLVEQIMVERSRSEGESFDANRLNIGEEASVFTGFCLVHEADRERKRSDSQPVLPLAKMSIETLRDRADQLAHEYNEETELIPYWLLQTDAGIYPLAPTDSRTSDAVETRFGSPRQ